MDITWAERISLFRWAILAALAGGLVAPLVGCFLLLRRTSFYGIALPALATAGVVCGFAVLPWWIANVGLGDLDLQTALFDSHAAMNYHLSWAALFTFGGLAVLSVRRGAGNEIGRVAAAFALANALTIVFGRLSPLGLGFVDELVQGEITGVGVHEFETLAGVLALVALLFVWFHRDFLLVSYDEETARVLGMPARPAALLLQFVTGATVAVGTMVLGPTLLFGLLVLPPLAARPFARSMTSLYVGATLAGALAVLLGVALAFEFDLPMGAAIVAAAGLVVLPGGVRSLFGRGKDWSASSGT